MAWFKIHAQRWVNTNHISTIFISGSETHCSINIDLQGSPQDLIVVKSFHSKEGESQTAFPKAERALDDLIVDIRSLEAREQSGIALGSRTRGVV